MKATKTTNTATATLDLAKVRKYLAKQKVKQTPKATAPKQDTRKHLADLIESRNRLVEFANDETAHKCFEKVNTALMQSVAEIATRKTLVFLQANNATKGTETESNDNGTTKTHGYDISVKLLQTLYHDTRILRNPTLMDSLTDSADLVQTAITALVPYFTAPIVFDLETVLYTKQLKNGSVKEYTAFSLACKSIRDYITAHDKRQYKKLAYCIGIADNGQEVLTTKRPANDITDIDNETRTAFLNRYRLTDAEQTALANLLNGKSTTETATELNVSKRTVERAIKSAREKIAKVDKRVSL